MFYGFTLILYGGVVVVHDLFEIDGGHYAIFFGIHIGTGDFIHVENSDIKSVGIMSLFVTVELFEDFPADSIVFIFDGSVNPSVFRVHGEAAQMTS